MLSSVDSTVAPIETVNPATGKRLRSYTALTSGQVEERLETAADAFERWAGAELADRTHLLRSLASAFRERKEMLATLITSEMGKTLAEAQAEVEKCAWACDYYADNAALHLAPEPVQSSAARSYVAYRPLGAVLAIMPWNFPLFQVARFAVPAVASGNVALLKPAGNVMGCGLALEHLFRESGFPDGVFSTLAVRASQVAEIIADRRVAAVTFTGSEVAGSAVAATAGRYLKKTVLELGGSDAYIVLRDADIQAAARTAVRARFQNCGQSCIAAKRFIVEGPVYNAFCEAFVQYTRALNVGDPMDPQTTMGPLARGDLVDDLERQIDASRAMGAEVILGGRRIEGAGSFYEPTILAEVDVDMPAFCEETFGPAAAIMPARDIDEAVELANASQFGLGNNVWTNNLESGEAIAARLESGLVFINGMTASDPRLPFGGVKNSGYGRELAQFGMREFANAQTIWIA